MSHGDHTKVVQPADADDVAALSKRVELMSSQITLIISGCKDLSEAVAELLAAVQKLTGVER